jgi:DNA-binding Lrp family transcriptional regulator
LHLTDSLDARISRELGGNGFFQWDARQSYAAIAKRIGADEETVRYRIRRAQQSGAIQRLELVLNPHAIGHEAAGVEIEVDMIEKKTQEAVLQARKVDGVVFLLDFEGRILRAVIYYQKT